MEFFEFAVTCNVIRSVSSLTKRGGRLSPKQTTRKNDTAGCFQLKNTRHTGESARARARFVYFTYMCIYVFGFHFV